MPRGKKAKAPAKKKTKAKSTAGKTSKSKTEKLSIEVDLAHEPCGEGQAVAVECDSFEGMKKAGSTTQDETKIKKEIETFAHGLRVGWKAYLKDDVHPFHSVRDMTFGLQKLGVPIKNVESVRAFIRRRKRQIKTKPKSWRHFEGVDKIIQVSTGEDILDARPDTAESKAKESKNMDVESSSSQSDEECESSHPKCEVM